MTAPQFMEKQVEQELAYAVHGVGGFSFFFVVHATQFMDLGWWQAVAGGGQFVD